MDGALRGAFTGLSLNTRPAHLYRSLLEASAFGVRWIVDVLRDGGVPVRRFVATGGLPHHNPLLVQIYADVLGSKITIHASKQGPALGAAILGVLAAGKDITGFAAASTAMHAMARGQGADTVRTPPTPSTHDAQGALAGRRLDGHRAVGPAYHPGMQPLDRWVVKGDRVRGLAADRDAVLEEILMLGHPRLLYQ
jgi:ribulose kinase